MCYGPLKIAGQRYLCHIVLLLTVHGCSSSVTLDGFKKSATLNSVVSLKPITAKPGETVNVIGSGFSSGQTNIAEITAANGSMLSASMTVVNDASATFVMPEGAGLGLASVAIKSNGKEVISGLSFVTNLASNTLPILIDSASEVCGTRQYIDKNGNTQTGTRNCLKSTVDLTQLTAANVKSGVTINGVVGALVPESHVDCASDGATGCVTTTAYKSADMSIATAGTIKSGVTIAGVTGQFPSASYKLLNASSTPDLDAATFSTKIIDSAAFEYWDSAGTRHAGAGDADIRSANIASGVDIFGATGTITAPAAWDLRAGTDVVTPTGTVSGRLKTDCRNGATLATFDQGSFPQAATVDSTTEVITMTAHGFVNNDTVRAYFSSIPSPLAATTTYYVVNSTANTFQVSSTSGGAAINITANGSGVFFYKYGGGVVDIWDTIDDYSGAAVSIPSYTGWTSNNVCGGISTVATDPEVWFDATTTNGTTASTCVATPANCSLKDKITGHEWHKPDTTGRDWSTALAYCDGLTYNGKSDWRLPTQKEYIAAYTHGLVSTAGATNWITLANMQNYYWTSSTVVDYPDGRYAWTVNGAGSYVNTDTIANYKDSTTPRVMCLRP